VNEDSSFRLTVPEKAVDKPPVNIALECGTPLISVCIEGISRNLILDAGSNVSILQAGISSSDIKVTDARPYGVTGEVLEIKELQSFISLKRERIYAYIFSAITPY